MIFLPEKNCSRGFNSNSMCGRHTYTCYIRSNNNTCYNNNNTCYNNNNTCYIRSNNNKPIDFDSFSDYCLEFKIWQSLRKAQMLIMHNFKICRTVLRFLWNHFKNSKTWKVLRNQTKLFVPPITYYRVYNKHGNKVTT